ncbi:PREDICTED: SLIT and NTRK-like protein 4 [Branchiostoma belcheri]|uniref:SLIT and NTRK-like protein 4 n=1 Tax=Branchiostoma belcheri TaxID=7741 RepID=A0A6P4YN30_BRABE|nr:PREDICTED: SLIT and NTRK-like protein 4 [Branchiostoma belcheri]
MPRSKILVLFLLLSAHLHVVLVAAEWGCPDGCNASPWPIRICNCPSDGHGKPCSWVGHDGTTYRFDRCLDAVPTGFHRETRSIKLAHLRSSTLPDGSFPDTPKIPYIEIKQSNVSIIQPGAFRGLQSAIVLCLVDNRISSLGPDTFMGLEKLESLYLDKNVISSISRNAFRGLPNLAQLKLSQNHLTSVPVEAFLLPRALLLANLTKNRIATIHSNVMRLNQSDLRVIVDKNDLRCDENLTWFICILPRLRQIRLNNLTKCVSPAELQGFPLATVRNNICKTNTARSPEAYNKTISMEPASTQQTHTNVVSASQHTTEMDRAIVLGGGPAIINRDVNRTYTIAVISAVVVPLLFVLSPLGVFFIYKRWCGHGEVLARQDRPTEMQESDRNPQTGGPQPTPAQDQSSGDSETIQPYAVGFDGGQGPDSEIQPYAVVYKKDQEQNDICAIPLYGIDCPDTEATGSHSEADSSQQENTLSQPAATALNQPNRQQPTGSNRQQPTGSNQPFNQPEYPSLPSSADTEPNYEDEEEANDKNPAPTSHGKGPYGVKEEEKRKGASGIYRTDQQGAVAEAYSTSP